MELELVTVGTELLLGSTLDTNASEIARTLASVGARVVRRATVGDDGKSISDAVGDALSRTGFVITTGGLGPTHDDVTKRAVASLFDAPLELDQEYLSKLEERFQALLRRPMPPSNRSQAEVPRGAVVLRNQRGTAPGLWLHGTPGTVVLLPGVPHEMRHVLAEQVVPRLQQEIEAREDSVSVTRSHTLRTTGIAESALATELEDLQSRLAPVTLAYLPGFEGTDLRLTVSGVSGEEARALLDRAAGSLRPALGAHCYGEDDTDLAAVVIDRLRERRMRLAVAESCTGGLVGARGTAVAGSSDVFAGGVICYDDPSKTRDLLVPAELIATHGAVSEPVVRAMADGVTRRFDTAAGISVTGIAGPTGGTPDKPVGTVWLCVRVAASDRAVVRRLPGERDEVRQRSAQAALDLLRRSLEGFERL